jgi:hypothetical protein
MLLAALSSQRRQHRKKEKKRNREKEKFGNKIINIKRKADNGEATARTDSGDVRIGFEP